MISLGEEKEETENPKNSLKNDASLVRGYLRRFRWTEKGTNKKLFNKYFKSLHVNFDEFRKKGKNN